jgi:hypothetical protein
MMMTSISLRWKKRMCWLMLIVGMTRCSKADVDACLSGYQHS